MKHIVNFSGGACAFWAAYRVIEKHGRENVVLLFADTLVEDETLYAFNEWAGKYLGVPITRICEGRTPWQLFRDEGFIGNSLTALCSIRLKREPLDLWRKQNAMEMDSILYLGFDFTEWNRLDEMRLAKPDWRIEAPMTEEPLWDKCKIVAELSKLSGFPGLPELPKQKLYDLGFPHNNCGGRCVTAGITHWVHLYRVLPDRFLEWENEEQITKIEFEARGIEFKSMLKDRRGGETNNLTLKELRIRIEAGEKFRKNDWGGCGCAATFAKPNKSIDPKPKS